MDSWITVAKVRVRKAEDGSANRWYVQVVALLVLQEAVTGAAHAELHAVVDAFEMIVVGGVDVVGGGGDEGHDDAGDDAVDP